MIKLFELLLQFIKTATWVNILYFVICIVALAGLAIVLGKLKLAFSLAKENNKVSKILMNFFRPRPSVALRTHPVFTAIETFQTKLKDLNIVDPGRKQLFQDLMHIQTEVIQEKLEAFLKKHPASKLRLLSALELQNAYIKLINDCENTWNERWSDENIPSVVIDLYNKWSIRHGVIEALRHRANHASYDGFMDNIARTSSLFTAFFDATVKIQLSGWNTFSTINGALTGVVYKGHTIKPRAIDPNLPEHLRLEH